ncbi:MAG: hypothetical protein J7J51_05435 [Candidatus Omnitrophica bacterium]|nr:hypothetical protein [Candidatus Omnitrophota bacterium]
MTKDRLGKDKKRPDFVGAILSPKVSGLRLSPWTRTVQGSPMARKEREQEIRNTLQASGYKLQATGYKI